MIRELEHKIHQDWNKAAVKQIGKVPYYFSNWTIEVEVVAVDPEKTKTVKVNLPAMLYTICPVCFLPLKFSNTKESVKYELNSQGKLMDAMGDKWGVLVDSRGTWFPTTSFFSCQGHVLLLDVDDEKYRSFFRIWEKEMEY